MRIEPLSKRTLKGAMELLNRVFPVQTTEERSDFWLPVSLDISKLKKIARSDYDKNVDFLRYWVAIEKGRVIGTTGVYTLKKDRHEACWLSWFCVDPEYRGRGIGEKLLEFTIEKVRGMGKKFFRLYTSINDPNEAAAQKLYGKKGLLVKKEGKKRGKYQIVYRELKL